MILNLLELNIKNFHHSKKFVNFGNIFGQDITGAMGVYTFLQNLVNTCFDHVGKRCKALGIGLDDRLH